MINTSRLETHRQKLISEPRVPATYETNFGTVGLQLPYTSIVGDTPYTANYNFPYGVEQMWKHGRRY